LLDYNHENEVLIFCVEFWELSHLARDLSQVQKKITVVKSWATDKMTAIFTQHDNFDHFEIDVTNPQTSGTSTFAPADFD
jgi:hypothetical protein